MTSLIFGDDNHNIQMGNIHDLIVHILCSITFTLPLQSCSKARIGVCLYIGACIKDGSWSIGHQMAMEALCFDIWFVEIAWKQNLFFWITNCFNRKHHWTWMSTLWRWILLLDHFMSKQLFAFFVFCFINEINFLDFPS